MTQAAAVGSLARPLPLLLLVSGLLSQPGVAAEGASRGSGCLPPGRSGASFVACCQLQLPEQAARQELCADFVAADCSKIHACQEEAILAGTASQQQYQEGAPTLDPRRPPVRFDEMQLYLETIIFPYITFGAGGAAIAQDPVMLDIEHVLPQVLLALASEPGGHEREPVMLDVGAFRGEAGLAAVALWDAIWATSSSWPSFSSLPRASPPKEQPKKMKVIHVEASPDLCQALTAPSPSKPAHLVDGQVSAVCAAAGAVKEASTVHCPEDGGGHCHVTAGTTVGKASVDVKSISTITIASLVEDKGVDKVDVLKIDVEGLDFDVLRGAQSLLRQRRIRFVIFEVSHFWEIRRSEKTGLERRSGHPEVKEAIEFLEANGGYFCYFIGPEILIPLSPPWLSNLYVETSHIYNLLCAPRDDLALRQVVQSYSVISPRAAQFALAALPPSLRTEPECWACQDRDLNDVVLRRDAVASERYFAEVYRRIRLSAWDLDHIDFMVTRRLQNSGRVHEALAMWKKMHASCCNTPVEFQAQREGLLLEEGSVLRMLVEDAQQLFRRNTTLPRAAKGKLYHMGSQAMDLAWMTQWRVSGGAAFAEATACAVAELLAQSARLGHDGGAFMLALSSHFGECSGTMSARGVYGSQRWSATSAKWSNELLARSGSGGYWTMFTDRVAGLAMRIIEDLATQQ